MNLTSNELCNIIGYKIKSKEDIIVGFQCVKCGRVFSRYAHKNKVITVCCKDCGHRVAIIPKEYNDNTGDLIDYYVIPYNKYRKICNNKDLTVILSREILPEVKERIKLKYILKELDK